MTDEAAHLAGTSATLGLEIAPQQRPDRIEPLAHLLEMVQALLAGGSRGGDRALAVNTS